MTTNTPILLPLAAAGFVSSSRSLVFPRADSAYIACGSRSQTFKDFRTAVRQQTGDFVILLVDSEGPVEAPSAWAHLHARDGWQRPAVTIEDQAHLMVQCMEAWFLADREALIEFYGQGFLAGSLPGQPNIEQIPKRIPASQTQTRIETHHERPLRQDPARIRPFGAHRSAKIEDCIAPRKQAVRRTDSRDKPVSPSSSSRR